MHPSDQKYAKNVISKWTFGSKVYMVGHPQNAECGHPIEPNVDISVKVTIKHEFGFIEKRQYTQYEHEGIDDILDIPEIAVAKGTPLLILKVRQSNWWCLVATPQGNVGWVSGHFLSNKKPKIKRTKKPKIKRK